MRHEWRGLAALVLATGVALAVVVIAVGAAWHTGPISQSESTVLSTVLGAAVGAVATYLGGASRDRVPTSSSSPPTEVEDLDHDDQAGDYP